MGFRYSLIRMRSTGGEHHWLETVSGSPTQPGPLRGPSMPTYRMVYGDEEQVVRETYHDVDLEREDGWTVLFRGNEAILRARDEHIQSIELLDEDGK